MTPKEALLNLVTLMRDEYNFPFNLTTEYKVLKQSLTELEELKRDVKSVYAELMMYLGNNIVIEQEEIDLDYLLNVIEKLLKVGVKDV